MPLYPQALQFECKIRDDIVDVITCIEYFGFRFRVRVGIGVRVRVSFGGRVRVSFFGSFRVRFLAWAQYSS